MGTDYTVTLEYTTEYNNWFIQRRRLLKCRTFARITTVNINIIYVLYIEQKFPRLHDLSVEKTIGFPIIFVFCKHDLALFLSGIFCAPLSWLNLNSNTKTRYLNNNSVNTYDSLSNYTYRSSFDWLLSWFVICVLEI